MKKALTCLALPVAFLAVSSRPALACAACYGDTSGSRMGMAATWGVFAMVVIMFGMLSAVGGFIYYLNWRGKNPLPDYEELLGQDGTQPNLGN